MWFSGESTNGGGGHQGEGVVLGDIPDVGAGYLGVSGSTLGAMTMRTVFCIGLVVAFGILGGCSTFQDEKYQSTGNPLLDLRNPSMMERERIAAAREAWEEVEAGVRVRERTRQAFKNLAWSGATPHGLRVTILDLLMSDTSEEGAEDSRRMARLLLPTEKSPEVVRVLCERSAANGWDDLVPAIVRSYSRVSPNVPDGDRDERRAIEALRPGMSVEEVIFETFLRPAAGLGDTQEQAVLRVAERVRGDAWGLLSRLDQGSGMRERMLARVGMNADMDAETVEVLGDLRAVHDAFGILPNTALELRWVQQIRRNSDKKRANANAEWWRLVHAAVSRLDDEQRRGLALRHLEPIRWAAAHRPAWGEMDRRALRVVLNDRLSGRKHQKRKAQKGESRRLESLKDWSSEMEWADILTMLVVDEAVMQDSVIEQVFVQRDLDKKDSKTEYGGILDADDAGVFRAVLFRPRARDRVSDERFVASDDMMRFSDRSLAHYHFHANKRNNAKYAGPSRGDLIHASLSGRTCVVLTSLGKDELNVDVYLPSGVVIDLGKIIE